MPFNSKSPTDDAFQLRSDVASRGTDRPPRQTPLPPVSHLPNPRQTRRRVRADVLQALQHVVVLAVRARVRRGRAALRLAVVLGVPGDAFPDAEVRFPYTGPHTTAFAW